MQNHKITAFGINKALDTIEFGLAEKLLKIPKNLFDAKFSCRVQYNVI